jgi:hypothetical protein
METMIRNLPTILQTGFAGFAVVMAILAYRIHQSLVAKPPKDAAVLKQLSANASRYQWFTVVLAVMAFLSEMGMSCQDSLGQLRTARHAGSSLPDAANDAVSRCVAVFDLVADGE